MICHLNLACWTEWIEQYSLSTAFEPLFHAGHKVFLDNSPAGISWFRFTRKWALIVKYTPKVARVGMNKLEMKSFINHKCRQHTAQIPLISRLCTESQTVCIKSLVTDLLKMGLKILTRMQSVKYNFQLDTCQPLV